MNNITCDVIRDLLPLYVDGVLSEDSKGLVEAHLNTCAACRSCCEKLTDTDVPSAKKIAADEKAAIRGIRKKINRKRIRTVCIAVVLVAVIAAGLHYRVTSRERYVPYEESGLYVQNGVLYTKEWPYAFYGCGSPEEGTIFCYTTTTTFYNRHFSLVNDGGWDILHEAATPSSGEDAVTTVYYVTEEYAKKLMDGYWIPDDGMTGVESATDFDLEKNRGKLEEIKAASVLVWEAEETR